MELRLPRERKLSWESLDAIIRDVSFTMQARELFPVFSRREFSQM